VLFAAQVDSRFVGNASCPVPDEFLPPVERHFLHFGDSESAYR